MLPTEVVSEDGCSSGVSLFANFFEEAGTTQSGITLQSLEDIWFVRIQIAGFDAGAGRRRTNEVVPHDPCDRSRSLGRVH